MSQPSASPHIQVHIEGGVSGQLAIGENILQIGEIHGGIVNIIAPDKKPNFSQKARPVFIRPHPFPGLLNRTEELGTAFSALRVSESVSIHGQNGVGKTALLRYLSYKSPGDNFPDGIIYLPAGNLNVEDLLQVIFDSFYESDRPAKPSTAQLHQLLQNICALILLDDAALEYDQVSELINSLPQCSFVFASLERCLWGEGRCIPLDGLPIQEALTLIERELGRSLQATERSTAAAFCQKTHGHPLQIIQAAALVRQGKTFTEIGDTFCESEDAFTRYIIAQLTAPQRRVLALLAVSGNFPISVDHLAGISQLKDLGVHLKPLLDDHLIQANSPAYNLTGALALSLGRIADLTEAENRLLTYFVEWIRQDPAVSEVTDSLNLLLSLTERAKSQGHWKEVISLGRGIEKALILNKRWQAWSQVLDSVLNAAVAIGDRVTQGWALHELGTRHLCLGNLGAARQSLTEALEIRHALGNEAGAAVTQHNLGLIAAPPAPPRHPPGSKPGPAPASGGSSVFKIILGLVGIGVLALAGVVLWNLIRPPQPTPTGFVVPPPAFTNTFTFTPLPSDTPRSTNTLLPTATETQTPTPTPTLTPSQTPTYTFTPSPTATFTLIPSLTYTPTPIQPIVLFDFVDKANLASWSGSNGALEFPGQVTDSDGFVLWQYEAVLEDGNQVARVLETHPTWKDYGSIAGWYKLEGIVFQEGDLFVAWVGFLQGAEAGNVTFRVRINYGDYQSGCGEFGCTREYQFSHQYNGEMILWNFTLPDEMIGQMSNYAYLIVDADSSSSQDWAVWLKARLVRP